MNTCQYIQCNNPAKVKYCSLSCGRKQQLIDHPPTRIENIVKCVRENCDNTFNKVDKKSTNIYCSRSCAVIVNNSKKLRKNSNTLNCLRCNNTLNRNQMKFCSYDCSSKFKTEENIRLWLDGLWDGSTSQGLSVVIRDYLIAEAEYRCASPDCAVPGGWSVINVYTGKVPLQVDHIDGDAFNNKRENLIVLCGSCHTLTPTYGARKKFNQNIPSR